jgi:polyphenol oxidase
MIHLDRLGRGDGIRHAFFTRRGGVSEGLFASLNCGFGSGDAPESVARNRAIAMQSLDLPPDRLVTCRQIHSSTVVIVESPWRREDAPAADGMVTRVPGVALGVLAADCAPVLLHDPRAHIIGAAHAGWRGALAGVVEATIARMEILGAERRRICAGIGPCIGHASYEVGPEFPQPIIAEDPRAAACFTTAEQTGRLRFGLAAYVEHRLARFGVESIERSCHDTAAEEEEFFSYRRARRRGETVYGRVLSALVLVG